MSIIQEALRKAEKKEPILGNVLYNDIIKDAGPRPGRRTGIMRPVYAAAFFILLAVFIAIEFSALQPKRVAVRAKPPAVVKENLLPVAEPYHAPVAALAPAPVQPNPLPRSIAIPVKPVPWEANFNLSGIMRVENGLRAIVNNVMVIEGDTIGEALVTAITDNSVALKIGDSEIRLRLK